MSNSNYKSLIDDLGTVRAEKAELLRREKAIQQQLDDACGVGSFEGTLFRVTISDTKRKNLDMKAVRRKLSPQFIRANTKETPVRKYQVSARSGESIEPELPAEELEDA